MVAKLEVKVVKIPVRLRIIPACSFITSFNLLVWIILNPSAVPRVITITVVRSI